MCVFMISDATDNMIVTALHDSTASAKWLWNAARVTGRCPSAMARTYRPTYDYCDDYDDVIICLELELSNDGHEAYT